ncbi:MAG: GHKL domain-containing protein [Oscillospiraceae bacterium]
MTTIINIILHFIADFLVYCCVFAAIKQYTHDPSKVFAPLNMTITALAASLTAVAYTLNDSLGSFFKIIGILIFYSTVILLPSFIFRRFRLSHLYITCFLLSLLAAISQISLNLSNHIFNTGQNQYLPTIIGCIVNLSAFLVLMRVSGNESFRRFTGFLHFIPKYLYILILLFIFCMECISDLSNIKVDDMARKASATESIFAILSGIMLLITLILITNTASKMYFQKTAELLEQQLKNQLSYYLKLDAADRDMRRFRHDYEGHMLCLTTMLQDQKTEEAVEYLRKLSSMHSSGIKRIETGNYIADAILNEKVHDAEKCGAEIKFAGSIPADIPETDLCVILSNALNNAVEACRKDPSSGKKTIRISGQTSSEFVTIKITNPVFEPLKTLNGSIQTSKENSRSHGLGLLSIEQTAQKNHGKVKVSYSDSEFQLMVTLKMINQSIASV